MNFTRKNFDPNWSLEGVGDSHDYRVLLANYQKVSQAFLDLDESYQMVIADICEKMGNGMADFAEVKVQSVADYDLYCHYVAGLVGHGLSGLFSASGLESPELKNEKGLANSMGLFLQKTNIIRDYHADLHGDRTFWPKEIWGKYADELGDFEKRPNDPRSLACLNHLVTDALQHIPDCLSYMNMLRNTQVFRFCAIPQAMALATLAKVYKQCRRIYRCSKDPQGLGRQVDD